MDEALTSQVFFEIHQNLPREGPGSFEATQKALSLLPPLPNHPRILDLGCGPGMQTLDLLRLTNGYIVAVDTHQPFLNQLAANATQQELRERLTILNADMAALELPPNSFDVVWAEGSAYGIGFGNALRLWRPLLKCPGYLAATEITWLQANRPDQARQFFQTEYPAMQTLAGNLDIIQQAGYGLISHFTLPESAWWRHYYTPMAEKLPALRKKYADHPAALEVIELHEQEISLYRQYSHVYGYEFYVMQVD